MAVVEVNWNPNNRQLRQFGVVAMIALPLLGWIWNASGNWLGILAAIGVSLALVGWILPKTLHPLFIGLSLVTIPIGIVIGEVALFLVYFTLVSPIGIVFKWMGRDAMRRHSSDEATFWLTKKKRRDPKSYFRQF